jgi:hypothetical protein
MKTYREVCRLSLAVILALGCSTTIAQAPPAKPPAASPPAAGAVASGQAVGTLTANGKTIKLAYAYAFVDEGDKKRPVILLLTEQQVPAASWKGDSDIMTYRMFNKNPLRGVAFHLNDKRELMAADIYEHSFPTGTVGIFALKFDGPAGKTFAGTAKSTEAGAKLSEPVSLSASFNATLK